MPAPRRVAAIAAVAFLAAGCAAGGTQTTTVAVTRTVTTQAAPTNGGLLAQTENARYFGTPSSITKLDATRYLLVLKPEFFLVGVAANVLYAAQQGTPCQPLLCPGAPDDHWVAPAGNTELTFVLPATTTGTVVTVGGQIRATKVTAAGLAAIVAGTKTIKLMEPLAEGLWLTVDVDKVTSFAEQYQP